MKKKPFQITPKFAMGTIALLVLGILAFVVGVGDFNSIRHLLNGYVGGCIFAGLSIIVLIEIILGCVWKQVRKWKLLATTTLILCAFLVITICFEGRSWVSFLCIGFGTTMAILIELGVGILYRKYKKITRVIGISLLALLIGCVCFYWGYAGWEIGGKYLLKIFRNARSLLFVVLGALIFGQILLGSVWKPAQKWNLLAIYFTLAFFIAVTGQVVDYVMRPDVMIENTIVH